MKQMDKFEILKKSTELMGKMDIGTLKQLKGADLGPALKKAYKSAETALLSHTRQVVSQIKTIADLTDCFVDTCYGIGSLGLRCDLLRNKLLGEPKSGQDALSEAIEKDTRSYDGMASLANLGCETIGFHFNEQNAESFSDEAYNSKNYFLHPDDINMRALTLVYLINHLLDYSIDLDLSVVSQNLQYNSCLKSITGKEWVERSLAGYFAEDDTYKINDANHEFINLFASKLNTLLSQAGAESTEYFKALQIKQHLHKQIISVYSVSSGVTPLEVYAEIDMLIATSKTSKGITQELVEDACYSRGFAVTTRYSAQGMSYELNTEGVQALADILEALKMDELHEAAMIIGKIRAVCA